MPCIYSILEANLGHSFRDTDNLVEMTSKYKIQYRAPNFSKNYEIANTSNKYKSSVSLESIHQGLSIDTLFLYLELIPIELWLYQIGM